MTLRISPSCSATSCRRRVPPLVAGGASSNAVLSRSSLGCFIVCLRGMPPGRKSLLRKLVDMNRSNVHRGKKPCELGRPLVRQAVHGIGLLICRFSVQEYALAGITRYFRLGGFRCHCRTYLAIALENPPLAPPRYATE